MTPTLFIEDPLYYLACNTVVKCVSYETEICGLQIICEIVEVVL